MGNNRNWKGQLQAIIDEHNERHGAHNKSVSHKTQSAYGHGLFHWFRLLRAAGFQVAPPHLKGRHVEWIVKFMTADPAVAPRCREKDIDMPAKPFSAAYIQQQLSILRVFCTWIGKPGMVLAPERYVSDPALVRRTYTAQTDKGWSGNGVSCEEAIAAVADIDAYVAAQLNLMLHFGLRRKEAVMFHPHVAVVPAHAVPATHPVSDHYVAFLTVKRGTKGGRLRFTAVRTDAQHRALERARELARSEHAHLGRPGLSLKQSLNLFGNVIRKAGITKKLSGVTPHGLRHQFAGDLFFEVAKVQAPVRGGDPAGDPEVLRAALLEVARQLGHNRVAISNAYLGKARHIKTTDTAQDTP